MFLIWNCKSLHGCRAAHLKANGALMLRKIQNLWSNGSTSKSKLCVLDPASNGWIYLANGTVQTHCFSRVYAELGTPVLWVEKGLFLCSYAATLAVLLSHPPYSAVFFLTLRYRHEINIGASRTLEIVFQQLHSHLHENLSWVAPWRHNLLSYILVICVLFSREKA